MRKEGLLLVEEKPNCKGTAGTSGSWGAMLGSGGKVGEEVDEVR